jgi:hypothetical protein
MNRPSYSDKIKRRGNPGIEFMANLYALPWFDIIT